MRHIATVPWFTRSQPRVMLFHLPGAVTSGMREGQMGSRGAGGHVGGMASARVTGKWWEDGGQAGSGVSSL